MGNRRRLQWVLAAVLALCASAVARESRAAATPGTRRYGGWRTGGFRSTAGVLIAQDEPPPEVEEAEPEPGVAYPTSPPPDIIPEYPPPAPGYGYVWIRGYWDWTGYEWTWNSGFWTPRQPGVTFYGPRFVFINGEPVYYRAYWVDPYGRRAYGYGWRGAPPLAWRARPSVAPMAWRAQHSEGWRRVPGAPPVWRGPARRGFAGGPVGEPRRFERGPAGRPVEAGRQVGGGWRGGPSPHAGPAAPVNRAPFGGGARPAQQAPQTMSAGAHHPVPAPHPAAPGRRR